eukprot:12909035-Prorocentrum_lima.AAC.1
MDVARSWKGHASPSGCKFGGARLSPRRCLCVWRGVPENHMEAISPVIVKGCGGEDVLDVAFHLR